MRTMKLLDIYMQKKSYEENELGISPLHWKERAKGVMCLKKNPKPEKLFKKMWD